MHTSTLAQIALALLVAVGIVGGLLTVGGPEQGRKERHDSDRLSDIRTLSVYVKCLAQDNGKRLPDEMKTNSACPASDRLSDPFTGEAYRYERLSNDSYQICASFESPEPVPSYLLNAFHRPTRSYTPTYNPSHTPPPPLSPLSPFRRPYAV